MNYIHPTALISQERQLAMIDVEEYGNEERSFGEFRRKVRAAEVLSAAITGRLSVVVQKRGSAEVGL